MERLNKVVTDQLGCKLEIVNTDSHLVDDLCCDSLDVVELCMAVEEEFEIEIPDADYEAWRTVGDIEKYLADRPDVDL
jgi:acyl carrier protein